MREEGIVGEEAGTCQLHVTFPVIQHMFLAEGWRDTEPTVYIRLEPEEPQEPQVDDDDDSTVQVKSLHHQLAMGSSATPTQLDDQVTRFCRQFLQYDYDVELPSGEVLREADVQDHLFKKLFAEDTIIPLPPRRYRLRILKQLVAVIEGAIIDWDEHVS